MDGTEGHLFSSETFQIRGAAFEVYRSMGAGFLEAVYQECLAIEFERRRIPFQALKPIRLSYAGRALQQSYVADFDAIILELKHARAIAPEHRAQIINYLRATGVKLGLLLNFGTTPTMQIERFAL